MAAYGPRLFTEGPVGPALVRFAIPVMLGNLLQTGFQLTDAFWVGRLGAAAVAAVSLNMPVMFSGDRGWSRSRHRRCDALRPLCRCGGTRTWSITWPRRP